MSAEPGSATPAAPPPVSVGPTGPRLSVVLTILLTLVVAAYVIAWPLLIPLFEGRAAPVESLEEPGRTVERLVEREMDLARALSGAPPWEWWLYTGSTAPESAERVAREWYEEVLEVEDSPLVRLEHAVLLGESGGAVDSALAQWAESPAQDERLQSWVRAAYLDPPPLPADASAMIAEIRDELGRGWFGDVLRLRIAERIGDEATATAAETAILRRGSRLAARLRLLVGSGFGLVALGLVAWLARPRRGTPEPIGSAALPAAWPVRDGWALFVRGLGAPQALAVAFFYVVRRETPVDPVVGILADLALFAWVFAYLRGRGERPAQAFGLIVRPRAGARLVRVTLGLIALTLAGDIAIDLVGPLLGLRAHWADGLPEDLLWSPPWKVALDTFDAVVWAPVVEELTFRGLLYGTLRTRLRVLPAAALSAIVFVLPHDYGVAGSVSVFWSGVIWALAYERTRSLLPAMIAHAANNTISTVWTLATLRF